jgi:hypothetical protein
MAIDKEIARLSKILVDTDDILFSEAEARLRTLKLEIVVGGQTASPAAHAAVLTAVSVGRRTFLGGVRVTGILDQPLLTALPIEGPTLGNACAAIGAQAFDGNASFTIIVGETDAADDGQTVAVWWDGWDAGVRWPGRSSAGDSTNPLAGIAAGALAVGCGFDTVRGKPAALPADIQLWEQPDPPAFAHVFLPGAVWIVGLGNLGQAFSWALASMPYARPADVQLILHDFDWVSEENWGTSVLVPDGTYGGLKTKLAEEWLDRRGFSVRRVDRRLRATDRVVEGEPRLAFSGLDKISARRDMESLGFGAIVDAGLGRTAGDFDRFRVTVFHRDRPIGAYFAGMEDPTPAEVPSSAAYQALAKEDRCGAAEVAGASVAVPHVSAVAAGVALARMIALVSGQSVPPSTARRTSAVRVRPAIAAEGPQCPGILHAGRPQALGQSSRPSHNED